MIELEAFNSFQVTLSFVCVELLPIQRIETAEFQSNRISLTVIVTCLNMNLVAYKYRINL